jgi:tryptophan-rich hypothetical protein
MSPSADDPSIIETRAWVERVVIGLQLCPFAPAPAFKGTVRYATSDATTPEALLEDLAAEMQRLSASPPEELETTLLVHPQVLQDFEEYNDFLAVADELLGALGLRGELQIASFHPQYRFAGTDADDIGNATNRSPYPILHLLREASITRAVETFGDTSRISADNIATLEALGHDGLEAVRRGRAVRRSTTTHPPSHTLSPRKLLHTKWTAVEPKHKEKHFLVTRVVEPEPPGSPVVSVEIEAVHSGRVQLIAWRELKDATRWKRGWV